MATLTGDNATGTAAEGEARRQGSEWGEKLARAGYYAKGFLYVVIGVLAIRAAFGMGGDIGGSKNALAALAGEGTLGQILLWVIGIGLVGYALWNAFRGIMDPENEGDDKKGIGKRIFFGISAVIHASLAIFVFTELLSGSGGGSGGEDGTEGMVGKVLAWGTFGRIAVAGVGIGIFCFAVQQLIKAWKVDLSDQLMFGKMGDTMKKVAVWSGRGGLAARGVVFGIVGFFLVLAAYRYDSDSAAGMGEVLKMLGGTGGSIVLAIVAFGLFLYGVHMMVKGRYRRIEV